MPILSQPVLDLIRHSYDSYLAFQYHKLYYENTLTAVTIIVIVVLITRFIVTLIKEDLKKYL
jgi:hypothetical protein